MDIKTVRALADLMEEKSLSSLAFAQGDTRINLVRASGAPAPFPSATTAVPEAGDSLSAPPPANSSAAPEPAAPKNGEEISSPLVGMAYFAATPGAQPFVKPKDRVTKGQTLCIIEAMKVMNEFAAPRAGEISEVCFEDGQLVEYGQPLFRML